MMCINRFAVFVVFLHSIHFISPTLAASFNCSQPPNLAKYDVNSCCRVPVINLDAAHRKCEIYIKSIKGRHPQYPLYAHVCYPECMYRETGALVDGEIKIENVKKFLEINVNQQDKDIVPNIVRSFEACLANIKAHMQVAGIKSYAKLTPDGCSPYASMVFGCVNAETFLHCPPKMWKKERYCSLAKEYAEQCNPLPHVPLPAA